MLFSPPRAAFFHAKAAQLLPKHRCFFPKPPLFREKAAVFLCELRKVKCNLIDRFAAIPHQLPPFCPFGAFS